MTIQTSHVDISTQKFARQTKTTRSDRSFPRLPFFLLSISQFPTSNGILCRFVFDSDLWDLNPIKKINTLPKTNMDTPNDRLEKVTPLKIWPCLVSMLVFGGVPVPKNNMIYEVISIFPSEFPDSSHSPGCQVHFAQQVHAIPLLYSAPDIGPSVNGNRGRLYAELWPAISAAPWRNSKRNKTQQTSPRCSTHGLFTYIGSLARFPFLSYILRWGRVRSL